MGTLANPVPLAAHQLFRSHDLDETRDRVAQVFCPHRLETLGRAPVDARHNHIRGERLSLNYMEYGAQTRIEPGELGSFYLIQIPLSGGAQIANGADRYASDPTAAAVLNPHKPTAMTWAGGTRQVLVQIDRIALQRLLSDLLGAQMDRPLKFNGPLDLCQGPGMALRQFVLHLVQEIDAGRSSFGQAGLMNRQIESTLMTGLIEALDNNYSGFLGRPAGSAAPYKLRRAEEFIEARLDQPLTVEEIARAAGTSARSLQMAFRQFRGTTPLSFLRDRRLDRVHQALMAARPGATVTDIASEWGFTHLGRFSQCYHARFGQTPRETLRAALGGGRCH
ncbi:AraC family transcriptional regulator [Antarcticimicrobium luteum]|uniref:AraC family transcriptional regulator n=1 Tax=Antarcticimicrobium luteum TaxID=2547397 RepID=A0A4R5UXJ3_9RHOB|nr:AraC family transcriptional regulator [Antarcticimicrobium luteum]TDK43806.1 AraC family transcriptional regulator [Antarcticimicrobium luteum]